MTTPLRPRSLQSLSDQQRFAQTGGRWSPPPLSSLDDTGLTKLNVADHVLKILYFGGDLTGSEVADRIRLPFSGVLDSVFEFLKREKFIEVRGATQGYSEATYRYLISMKGTEKAQEVLLRSQYAGPAPVPSISTSPRSTSRTGNASWSLKKCCAASWISSSSATRCSIASARR